MLGKLMTKGEQNGPLHWFDVHIMFQLQERTFCSPLNLYMYMHVWFSSISSLIWMLFHFKEELIKTDLERPDKYNLNENKLCHLDRDQDEKIYLSQKLLL